MTRITNFAELSKKLAALHFTQSGLQIIADIADALVKVVEIQSESSDALLGQESFHQYFSNVLLVHHATNDDKFKKKAFEFAFRGACAGLGLNARITANPMNPGADVMVGSVRFSLKTEAGEAISPRKVVISKLMEARWIREISSHQTRGTQAATKVLHHLKQYDRILVLRAFDVFTQNVRTAARYELWEIPKALLLLVGRLRDDEFSQPTANNSFAASVKVIDAQTRVVRSAFSFRMDGSVEKVTISSLAVTCCVHHVTWIVPLSPSEEPEED